MNDRLVLWLSIVFTSSAAVSCGANGGAGSGRGDSGRYSGAGSPRGRALTVAPGGSAPSDGDDGSGGGRAGADKWVSGYYVGYEQSLYPPSVIDWSGLTHLLIGRVVPNADGSLNTTFDVDSINGPILGKTLAQLAHQHGKKAIIMLGGAGTHDGFAGAGSAESRAVFVQNLVKLAADYGFDGFDLDWEPLSEADQPSFRALAEALRAALPKAILTFPVGWVAASVPAADTFYGSVAPLFDQINIMSYTMVGTWPGWQSWHSSALHGESPSTPTSIDSSVKAYLAAGVPAEKLGIGIGFSGMCWSGPVTGPKKKIGRSKVVANDHVMSFDHLMSAYYSDASHNWDATAEVPYLSFSSPHGPEGCTFVSYDDPQSIAAKGQYVKQMGLGGTQVWTINQGYRPNQPAGQKDPLMHALGQAFLGL